MYIYIYIYIIYILSFYVGALIIKALNANVSNRAIYITKCKKRN